MNKKPRTKMPGAIIKNHGATRFRAKKAPHANVSFAARITVRSRQSLLKFFRFALKSPFPHPFPAAIPPPAALFEVQKRGTFLSLRFTHPF